MLNRSLLAISLVCTFIPISVFAEISLSFGIYSADKPTEVVRQFRPILNELEKMLSEDLGEKARIRLQVSKVYEDGIANLVNGKVDFGRLGPASYVNAKLQNPEIQILAAESKKGKKTFKGIICVHEDFAGDSLNSLKGKSFAFGNELSTIGRYLSQQHLYQAGIKASDLSKYEYLGRHDLVGTAVAQKRFDAGALKNGTYKKLVAKGLPLKTLKSFNNVTKPWIARANLDDKLATALTKALLSLSPELVKKHLSKDGFLAAADEDYQVILQSIEENDKFFKTS